jgi:hypothetical protein
MQISGVSLTVTWPLRLCLLRVLLGTMATATSFPLSKHTGGGDTAPAFSGWCVYLQLMGEVGLPPSPVEFSSHHHFYKLSHSWLLGVCCHSCLFWPACLFIVHMGGGPTPLSCGVFLPPPLLQAFPLLVVGHVPILLSSPASLFIYRSMRDSPPLPLVLRVPCPLCYVSFLLLLLIIQFFSLGGGWSVQGAMLIWSRIICGSTACCFAHLVVCIFPSGLGAGV